MGWLILMGILADYGHIIAGCAIGIPLCFVNPILGIAVGLAIGIYVKLKIMED